MMLLRIGRRVAMLLAVVFTAASLNFLLPKLAPKNPVETKLLQLTESGGALTANGQTPGCIKRFNSCRAWTIGSGGNRSWLT